MLVLSFAQAQINPSSLFLVIQNGDKMIKKRVQKNNDELQSE
ncbi:hypothetical protein CCAN2_1200002 [Capnocytophaga canimorsus]|nr:hypothetical protein CCAN2_1200002 [Capnocytophaga canimorsus]